MRSAGPCSTMRAALCLLAVSGPGPATAQLGATEARRPVTFTAEQARAGKATFNDFCATCHGADLGGLGIAAPLRGPDFDHWQSGSVADLFLFMSTQMPEDAPGSLPLDAYSNVLAYILERNGYPAGPDPLPAEPSALERLTLDRVNW